MVLSCAYTVPVCITVAEWFQMVSKLLNKSCSVYDIVYGNLVARGRSINPTPPGITQSHDIVGSLMHHLQQSS